MTAISTTPSTIRARPTGFVHDVTTIAGRALRAVPRDLEAVIPPVFIAIFFFVVNIATLERLTEGAIGGFDYTAFQMPTAILLGVTGVSRAPALVLDVQNGYFDRLLMTPMKRSAILLGHLVADVFVAACLTVPILVLGLILGAGFETGVIGVVVFISAAAFWSLAFAGFGYAVALKTGNPAAVQSMFLLFFPFLFLTTSYVPREQLSGWLDVVATFNPVTYILEGMRALAIDGWTVDVLWAVVAIVAVGALSMSMCMAALRGRVRRG
ncbi:ABC-2 type transport system permease protein [Ilumatobacter fluminis]|uniref:Transport permease protein n=1 Tax=Ilumatobacter fluminis TaxID=467091 RepID=A0A4R7I013_9ACTN|nr:ABC transporter permease [Ilumatobacter fluminis]TDT15773.1 ABC-2 type transport system permease protein [Ilumatobacter fluminis]